MYLKKVKVSDIIVGKYQMRFKSGKMDIEDLAKSIKINGLLCPPSVSSKGKKYVLVFGHRRFEAIKNLKWKEITAIVLEEMEDKDLVIKTLVENIEKVDLTPLEKAKAYQNMIEELKITQEDLASRCGRNRSEIAHHIRLLNRLNTYVFDWLHQGKVSFGHAKVLMELEDKKKRGEVIPARFFEFTLNFYFIIGNVYGIVENYS